MTKFKGLVVDLRSAILAAMPSKYVEYWDESEGAWKPVVSRPEDAQSSTDHGTEDDSSTHHLATRKGDSKPPKDSDRCRERDGDE
jgi:hypothetical protein